MAVYQTKDFKKWNKKNKVPNDKLLDAIKSINGGSGIVNLGNGLYKVRIAKDKGKSGGYRTIIIHQKGLRSLFVHGFEKSEKENISVVELREIKSLAIDFLTCSEDYIKKLLEINFIYLLEEQ